MAEAHATQRRTTADWQMPLSSEQYDRSPTLTQAEREALVEVAAPRKQGDHFFQPHRLSLQALARLIRPLQDIYDLKGCYPGALVSYLYWMCLQMLQMDKPFWAWSKEEWIEAVTGAGSTRPQRGVMITARVTAYLLCGLLIIDDHYLATHLARIVFGTTKVEEQYERLAAVIFGSRGFGYASGKGQEIHFRATLVLAMLVNRNPHIDALTVESLQATRLLLVYQPYQDGFRLLVRALVYLKIVEETTLTSLCEGPVKPSLWREGTAPLGGG